MDFKIVDPNEFIRWSGAERQYVLFGLDGLTIIGRSMLKESVILQFEAFLAQRNVLVKKGLLSKSMVLGPNKQVALHTDGTLSPEQRESLNRVEADRKEAGLLDEDLEKEANEKSTNNIIQLPKRS